MTVVGVCLVDSGGAETVVGLEEEMRLVLPGAAEGAVGSMMGADAEEEELAVVVETGWTEDEGAGAEGLVVVVVEAGLMGTEDPVLVDDVVFD